MAESGDRLAGGSEAVAGGLVSSVRHVVYLIDRSGRNAF